MTNRRRDAVDAFLEGLGTAPVPDGLAAGARRRIETEGPRRASRPASWLAAAATLGAAVVVLGGLAVIAGGPGPSPSNVLPPAASPPVAETPSPAGRTPGPTLVLPTPTRTIDPSPAEALFSVQLRPEGVDVPIELSLTVADASGTVASVAPWTGAHPSADDVLSPGFGAGSSDRKLVVAWIAFACEHRARLSLGIDASAFRLQYPARPGCDAIGVSYAVEITFTGPIDPASFSGRSSDDLVTVADVAVPLGVAFIDAQHGFTAWRTEPTDAVILETTDGGATWRVQGLGAGTITALAVTGSGKAWAGVSCPDDGLLGCSPGRYRFDADAGMWGPADPAWPVALSFSGESGAGLFASEETPLRAAGYPIADLAVTDDGGETWRVIRSPCGEANAVDVARVDAGTLAVLCTTGGVASAQWKRMLAGPADGSAWREVASTDAGTLPVSGAGARFDLVGDHGWMWGAQSPMLATADGGATWAPVSIADGADRQVVAADAMGGGAGFVIVHDLGRQSTTLYRTEDGRTWTPRFDFPEDPCCGG